MWSRSTEARTWVLLCTRNSSPACSSRGAARRLRPASSSSASEALAPASAMVLLEAYLPSCSAKAFLALPSSVTSSVNWSDIFFAPSLCASEFFVSRARAATEDLALSTSAWASLSSVDSLSQRAKASSSAMGSPASVSLDSGSAASAKAFTLSSAAETLSPVSCIFAVLRPSVSLQKVLSFAADALSRSVSFLNSSAAGFDTDSA
mmetsp:Transcript_99440/g.309821  ORF Transcript_99440/g.309821 Transcript_99440/m.309821 type:complete len:206 (+) Transcript_99440:2609-3226(+)